MEIYIKAGWKLRRLLQPDVDYDTRRVEVAEGETVKEILRTLDIDPSEVAFIFVDDQIKNLSYKPTAGQMLTLQPPAIGG